MPEDKPYIRKVYDFMQSAYGAKGKLGSGAFTNDFNTFYDKITTNEGYANKIYGAINDAYGSDGRVKKGAFTSKPEDFLGRVSAPKQFPMAEQLMDYSRLGKVQPVTEDPNAALAATATDIPQTLYKSADETFKPEKAPGVMSDISALNPLIDESNRKKDELIAQTNDQLFNTTGKIDPMTGKSLPLTDFQLHMKDYVQQVDEIDKNLQANQATADEFAKTTAGGLYYSFVRPVYQTLVNVGKNVAAGTARLAAGVGGGLGLEESERVLNKTADGLVDYFDFNRLAREGSTSGFINLTPTYQQGKLSRANILPKAMEAITSMATLMGGARFLGGNTPALFSSSFMSTYEDYRKTAKQAGLTDNESDQFALTSAGVTSILEMISPNRFLLRPGELSSATKGVFRAIKDGVPVKVAVKGAFKESLKEIGKENIQELSQAIGDHVVRGASDLLTGQNEFNEKGPLPSFDEALETVVLTTIATGVMSGRRFARNSNPSNVERSAWAQAAERPELIEQGIERGLENGTVTEEQAGKIRQNVAEYRNIYEALQAELSATNPNADVARVAFDAFKSQRLKQETQPLQGIPALAAVQEQTDQRNAELDGNIRDELAGIPEMGAEVSAAEVKDIMSQTGAENKLDQVGDNDYKVSTVDLSNLYRTNEAFKRYVDEERLTESKNKEGLITPVVISASGNIIDGMNRLAQQYVDGEKTARAFVGMRGISVQEDVQKPRVVPTASQERGITVQRPQDITRIDPITIGENQAPVVQEEQPFEIAPVFAGEEVILPAQEPVPAQSVAVTIEQTPVDQAKTRRDNAAAKLKEAWSAYGQMGIINDPGRNLERDKKFYSALANYVKEEILYRVNQVKGFATKKKAAMKREIIKSIREQGIEVDDLSQLNDAFEIAYEEAKNIPGVLSENNDRVSYRKYIKDRIVAREAGRKKGTKEATETAQQKVKDVRAAILETAKGTGVKLNIVQLRQLSRLLERAVKAKDIDKAVNDAIDATSQMVWESKNRSAVAQAKKLIKQARALKRNKNMVVRDVEWLQQIQFPNPNQVDDIDQYVEYLQNFTGTRKGNKEVSDATREEFQDFVDQENARIYSEKKAKWQAELDELIADDILPADVTLDEYIQLLEGQSVDRLDSGTNKKQDVLIGWIKPRLAALKSGSNEFTGPISAMNEDQKGVVDQLSSINIDELPTRDLIMLNNVLNNIAEYGSVDGAGPLITSYEARRDVDKLTSSDIKIRELPSQKVINKKNLSNIISALFYNDKTISQFREKTIGGIENKVSKVKDKAQNVVKEFVALNKKNKITPLQNARLFAVSYLNQYRGVEDKDISNSLNEKVSEMISDIEYLYAEGERIEGKKGAPVRKDAEQRLEALQSLGLIKYDITDGKLNIEQSIDFNEIDPSKAIEVVLNNLSAEEQQVYQFVLERYSDLSDKLEFITRTYANKEFRRERNYVSLVPRRKDGNADNAPDISEETDITRNGRSVNTRPSGTTMRRADKKPETVYYDGDFFSNFVNQYYQSLYTSEALPDLQRVAKIVNSEDFRKFIMGQFDKEFRGVGKDNYNKFKTKLAQVINDEKYSPFFRRGQSSLADALISRGVRAVLGNVWQGPKQYAPAVLHNFSINNPAAVTYAMRSRGKALFDRQYARDRQAFLKNFTGVQRSAVGSEAYDKYVKRINDDMTWWMYPAQWMDKVQKLSSFVLEKSDRAAQNDAYIGSYITSLIKQGLIKSPSEFDFAQHAEKPNKEALAYAEQMASNINNESAKAYRADVLTQGDYAKYLWLLQGFSLNAYQNAMNKAKIIGDNRATGTEKKEAAYHFLGYLGEMASYQVIGKWARNSQLAIAGAILSSVFGIKDDETEEEKKNKKDKENIRMTANVLSDITMSGMPAPAQAAIKVAVNYGYQHWAKIKVAEKKKEAKAEGGKFDPRGTYLSPYYVPFYGVEGPGGAADFYTAIGKKGIDLIEKGYKSYNSDADDTDTAAEKVGTNLNRYLGLPAAILGAGDLIILNNRMQQVIKNASKEEKKSAPAANTRNRRRRSSRNRARPTAR